jgi:hypothetical protein
VQELCCPLYQIVETRFPKVFIGKSIRVSPKVKQRAISYLDLVLVILGIQRVKLLQKWREVRQNCDSWRVLLLNEGNKLGNFDSLGKMFVSSVWSACHNRILSSTAH